jgi:hypothetical protein
MNPQLAKALNIIPNNILGAGTHGTIYDSSLYDIDHGPLVSKVVKNHPIKRTSCNDSNLAMLQTTTCQLVFTKEYSAQEVIHDELENHKQYFDEDVANILKVPFIRSMSYAPTTLNPQWCSYMMEKLVPIENVGALIQLAYYEDRTYEEKNHTGLYLGADNLIKMFGQEFSNLFVKAMASVHAFLHYGIFCDGYDIEYVLSEKNGYIYVSVLDFDKVSFYSGKYRSHFNPDENCIARKLTEQDYQVYNINTEQQIVRLLATSLTYDPSPRYTEYELWRQTYIDVATRINPNARDLAIKVLEFRKKFTM